MRDKLLKECWVIEDNSRFTAEAHHWIAWGNSMLAKSAQILPAGVAAVATALYASGDKPSWFLYVAAISATIAAVAGILDPMKSYYQHLAAAKQFVLLKHDARGLREAFASSMDDAVLLHEVKSLHEKYKIVASLAPPTGGLSFKIAQLMVKSGKHGNEPMPVS